MRDEKDVYVTFLYLLRVCEWYGVFSRGAENLHCVLPGNHAEMDCLCHTKKEVDKHVLFISFFV